MAVSARQWANLNPGAFARGPLSIDDVLAARMVSDPLSAADCCLVTDGGGACVVVRAERARDLPNAPVYFLGAAGAQWHRSIVSMPDLTVTAASESAPRAMQMAGVRHADIDLVMLYDAFTINTLLFLEDLGFCAKGEGGPFVQGGRIAPGGELAVNTNGGGLSCVHPGMYGMFLIIEAVTQAPPPGRRAAVGQGRRGVAARQRRHAVQPGNRVARYRRHALDPWPTGLPGAAVAASRGRARPREGCRAGHRQTDQVNPCQRTTRNSHRRSPFRQSYSIDRTTLGRGDRRFQRPDPHRWPTHRLHAAPWLCRANPPGQSEPC